MPFIFQYLLKLSFALIIIYLFYYLVLRRLTFYTWNRLYLLGYVLLSFFIPFIDIAPVLEKNTANETSVFNAIPSISNFTTSTDAGLQSTVSRSGWDWWLLVLCAGILIMLSRLMMQLFSYRRIVSKAKLIMHDEVKLYQVDMQVIPFSFGNSIFINRNLHTGAELEEIIRHEFVHVKQRHTLDIVVGELLCIFSWYNPFAWLIRKAIRQNLEFIADHKVLENGTDKKQYQYLLLKVIGNSHFSIANKFNFSSLKKRIAMMNKIKTAKLHLAKFIFLLPLLALMLLVFRSNITKPAEEKRLSPMETRALKKKQQGLMNANSLHQNNGETHLNAATPYAVLVRDTVAPVPINKKGYYLDVVGIHGQCFVEVKDKTRKLIERVDLLEWDDNNSYYLQRYGELLSPLPEEIPEVCAIDKICKDYEITETKAVMRLRNGKVETYDLTNEVQRNKFEEKYGKIFHVREIELEAPEGPVIIDGISAQTVIAPMEPETEAVMVISENENIIMGDEDVLLIITSRTTREQLEEDRKALKAKGFELFFDDIEYNNEGKLVVLTGTIKSGEGKANFVATDFEKLVLAMLKKNGKTYFKVDVKEKKTVI